MFKSEGSHTIFVYVNRFSHTINNNIIRNHMCFNPVCSHYYMLLYNNMSVLDILSIGVFLMMMIKGIDTCDQMFNLYTYIF